MSRKAPSKDDVPTFKELLNPLLQALHDLGGSGSIDEITQRVIDLEDISDEVAEIIHNPERSSRTELEYRLAWARTHLKKYGVIDNPNRGVWVIRPDYTDLKEVDPDEVTRYVRRTEREEGDEDEPVDESQSEEIQSWREELHRILTQKLGPDAFERLTKRMLRESGFIQVEVTQRSGDRGIDGTGIIQINGLLSFHVVFQCKRYQGSVSVGKVRDFRGAMVGRADKGLLITTGTFTQEAKREATRDGATPIDLIDGEDLIDMLKELRLGVQTETIEKVDVDEEWFDSI